MAGPDPNARGERCSTPLDRAVIEGNAETQRELQVLRPLRQGYREARLRQSNGRVDSWLPCTNTVQSWIIGRMTAVGGCREG